MVGHSGLEPETPVLSGVAHQFLVMLSHRNTLTPGIWNSNLEALPISRSMAIGKK